MILSLLVHTIVKPSPAEKWIAYSGLEHIQKYSMHLNQKIFWLIFQLLAAPSETDLNNDWNNSDDEERCEVRHTTSLYLSNMHGELIHIKWYLRSD